MYYFLNFALVAFLFNYLFLPYYYKNKKIAYAIIGFIISLTVGIILEELVLEYIFFPDERAQTFDFHVILGILPMMAILTGFKFGWDALNHRKELENLKHSVRKSELQFLKSQINPHFLFNNLNNLYSYALESSPKTPEIILELSSVLRYMLYDCKAAFVPLESEIEQLQNFINLSEMQIEGRGKVDLHIDHKHPGLQIAPLILIVFVENAFKHSQASQSEDIQINIQLNTKKENNGLYFICANNYSKESNNDNITKGIGLQNVRRRLDLIYPDKYTLDINDTGNWYEIALKISLSSYE